jgi:hypothetical protein
MNHALLASWDWQELAADAMDEGCEDPVLCWVPPNLGDLVKAARATTLRRFFPFTAHACFGLSNMPNWWEAGPECDPIAPAFVSRTRQDGYLIWPGTPYHFDEAQLVLVTDDPMSAAAALERLLAEWPASASPC